MEIKTYLFNMDDVRLIYQGKKTQFRFHAPEKDIKAKGIDAVTKESYYQTGDILYIRENFFISNNPHYENYGGYEYFLDYDDDPFRDYQHWIHCMCMPKEKARIWVKITSHRIEKLHDALEEDAYKNGFLNLNELIEDWHQRLPKNIPDEIKKRSPEYWGNNPWVYVIDFERCEKPEWIKEKSLSE